MKIKYTITKYTNINCKRSGESEFHYFVSKSGTRNWFKPWEGLDYAVILHYNKDNRSKESVPYAATFDKPLDTYTQWLPKPKLTSKGYRHSSYAPLQSLKDCLVIIEEDTAEEVIKHKIKNLKPVKTQIEIREIA